MNNHTSKKGLALSDRSESKGYTIIELLAVVAILVIISGVIAGILYSTLRGSNKTKISTEITENGNYAISVISAAILDSRSITNVGGGEDDISDCTARPSGTSITLRRLSGDFTTFSCSGDTISEDGVSIINSGDVAVEAGTCSFYCDQLSTDSYAIPIVGVKFKLKEVSSALPESRSSAIFNTAVSLRNYSP